MRKWLEAILVGVGMFVVMTLWGSSTSNYGPHQTIETTGWPLVIFGNCRTFGFVSVPVDTSCNINYFALLGDLVFWFFFGLIIFLIHLLVARRFPSVGKISNGD